MFTIKPIWGQKAPFVILNGHNWQQLKVMPIACWLVMYNKYLCTDHIVTPKSLPIVLEIRQEIGLYLLNTKLMFLWPQWMFSRQSFVKSVHVQTLVRGWLAFLVFNRTFHQTLFTLIGSHSCTIVNSSFFQLQLQGARYTTTAPAPLGPTPQCQCVSLQYDHLELSKNIFF